MKMPTISAQRFSNLTASKTAALVLVDGRRESGILPATSPNIDRRSFIELPSRVTRVGSLMNRAFSMRFADLQMINQTQHMKTPQQSGRRSGRRGGRSRGRGAPAKAPVQKGWWDKITDFVFGSQKQPNGAKKQPRQTRKPEVVEVTSPKLYVGNLSFDASESDLFELFNGVGSVQNAEIISHRQTQRSKGFAFVTMQSVDEAQRAVHELHDKEFMGRKLVVSGAKSSQ